MALLATYGSFKHPKWWLNLSKVLVEPLKNGGSIMEKMMGFKLNVV